MVCAALGDARRQTAARSPAGPLAPFFSVITEIQSEQPRAKATKAFGKSGLRGSASSARAEKCQTQCAPSIVRMTNGAIP
jgi:hypothetical protein